MIQIEEDKVTVFSGEKSQEEFPIGSPQAFQLLSKIWLRSGWDNKYVYSFTWLGRPIIQLPEDPLRIQEVIYRIKPDIILETGIAHGGSLIFYAGLCKIVGKGKVIGVDVEIRSHNRKAIENHELAQYITLIEGNSIDPKTISNVGTLISPESTTLVLLDSCHTHGHVLSELNAYSKFVSEGSYIVAMDGIMQEVVGAPRTQPDWKWNNPQHAVLKFVKNNPNFVIEEPKFLFNEGNISQRITYWPNAFLKRIY